MYKLVLCPINFHELLIKKLHQRLGHRHSDLLHRDSLLSASVPPPWAEDLLYEESTRAMASLYRTKFSFKENSETKAIFVIHFTKQ
ncbi:hypothetical protein D3C72_2122120 [compost metagenome]